MPPSQSVVSVSEITRQIKSSIELRFPRVWVEGEISNCKFHTSGHLYFTLKDEGAQISATMWRNRAARLLFDPQDGMKVVARGGITVYPPRGSYQLDVEHLQPKGIGELQLAFERLKQRLDAEGLFRPERKKPIPSFPERIGVVTSESGAALHDIRTVLERRMPSIELILLPVRVQGPGAAEEIANGLRALNQYGEIDVIIVGRGGGSAEDLWSFNEEVVARAIAASGIPVVSAVGHEVDFTIADFVADLRAPTPSAAAEMVVRDRIELLEVIRNMCYTVRQSIEEGVKRYAESVERIVTGSGFARPAGLVRESMQRVDELEHDLKLRMREHLRRTSDRSVGLGRRLEALNPSAVLRRGYAIVRKKNSVVSTAREWIPGDEASVQFHDGTILTEVRSSGEQDT